MTRTIRDLPKPFGICNICYSDQTHHSLDTGGECFHCHHQDTLAMPKADCSGWIIETGVSHEEYIRRAEAAATTLDLLAAAAKKMN